MVGIIVDEIFPSGTGKFLGNATITTIVSIEIGILLKASTWITAGSLHFVNRCRGKYCLKMTIAIVDKISVAISWRNTIARKLTPQYRLPRMVSEKTGDISVFITFTFHMQCPRFVVATIINSKQRIGNLGYPKTETIQQTIFQRIQVITCLYWFSFFVPLATFAVMFHNAIQRRILIHRITVGTGISRIKRTGEKSKVILRYVSAITSGNHRQPFSALPPLKVIFLKP